MIGVAATMIAISVLYLLFVIHFSMNVLFLDDWSVVPLVHAALHGGLTPTALWAQHNENRMLVPNLVQVGTGVITHDNTEAVIVLSAFVFITTYAVFLATFRSSLGRPLTPLVVLLLAAVWFSFLDWENALWAFQFAWYLILFFLIAMIYCLQRQWFMVAVALAVLASFSSFQGLALWPVGVVWLILRSRWWDKAILFWIASAVATTLVYLWNLRRYYVVPIWRYPLDTAKFLLIEVGEVVPRANDLRLHVVFGLLILTISAFVVVQSIRHDQDHLPVALITFGLLFDLFIALGREVYGYGEATHSNYTMPNILIVVAIVAYACAHLDRSWMLAVLAALVAVQLAVTTDSGLAGARVQERANTIRARIVVNFDRILPKEQICYASISVYGADGLATGFKYLELAKKDGLGEFSPGPFGQYRAEGLPAIPQCQ